MIAVEDLVKRYGPHLAVDHLSFTVEGGVFGFLGPNGAGKSTTMNMMTGYLEPTEGDVRVDGYSMAREPLRAKARLGYLPELPPLYLDMQVDEYLRFAAELKKVPRRAIEDQVAAAMARTDVAGVSGRLIRNLSKGYRQRVGLAMALLGNPGTLILDEPTVGLDPKQITEIRALIRDLAREHTVILSSHILSEVREVCDRILILHHGRAVAQGAPAQLEQDMAGEQSLEVAVRGEAGRVEAVLRAIPGVERLELLPGEGEGETGARLLHAPGDDLREAVFRACVDAGLPLLELRPRRATLEEIFLRLTSDEAPGESSDEDPETPPEDGDEPPAALGEADGAASGEDAPAQDGGEEGTEHDGDL